MTRRLLRVSGLALAVAGMAMLAVALLFAFLAHEDIRQADRWEDPLARNAEHAGDQAQAASIQLVFDTERAKLQGERRAWLWTAAGGGAALLAGLMVAWRSPADRPRTLRPVC